MSSPALWSLLHDVIGDGKDLVLGEIISQVTTDALRSLPLAGLQAIHPNVKSGVWEKFVELRSREAERARLLRDMNLQLLILGRTGYPKALYDLFDPPAILYQKGRNIPDGLSIGIVGSRKCTHYGRDMAEKLAADLSAAGISVISGLARGIDGRAHRGALRHGAGTVAVLGCGIDVVYPAEHASLYEEILAHPAGTILSECPLGSQPLPFRFPRRNRIVAALSRGVLVVEAAERSGALITARLANDIGRDVFALPGLVTSSVSMGPHRLIQDGAKLVMEINDILDEYGQQALFTPEEEKPVRPTLDEDQEAVYACLSSVPLALESIVEQTGLGVDQVIMSLSLLEIYGLAEEVVGRQYSAKQ